VKWADAWRDRVPRCGRAAALAAALAATFAAAGCQSAAAGYGHGGGSGSPAGAASPAAPSPAPGGGQVKLAYRYMTDLHNAAQAARYGYNLVDLGPYRSSIDALPAGERALVWIGNYSHATCSFTMPDASVRSALSQLAGDPKVAGYYIADDADYALPADGGHCPDVVAQLTARSRLVHQLAPGTFTYEVVSEPGNYAAFAHATDVMGADPYPCLRGRPCNWRLIPADIAALNAAHVPRYWAVLQAFGYRQWRFPTPAELARMISQWQRSRWQGEQTFTWDWRGSSLAQHPGLLAVLRNLNAGNPQS
jgi:hypothetical protein